MNRRTNSGLIFVLFMSLLLVSPVTGRANGEHEDRYERALNERLMQITSIQARFEQSTIGKNRMSSPQESGELWVEKPDRFRIVTGEPNALTLVSNGATFWSYDADLEQVIVSDLDKSVREVPILLFGGDPAAITSQYRVTFYEADDLDHFVLEPRTTTSLFTSLTIVFDGKMPRAISIRDNLGQQILMDFIDPVVNTDMDSGLFIFQTPDGVDVIDDRQSS